MHFHPRTRVRRSSGFTFVSILVAMLVLAALYFGYFRFQSSMSGERAQGIQSIHAAKDVACRTQRQQIERDVQMYGADHEHPPRSLDDLRRAGIGVPDCPEGGEYRLSGTHVVCSKHP